MAIRYRKLDDRKKKKFTIRLDNNTFSQLAEISIQKGCNLSDVIRGFLKESINNKINKEN